MSLIAAAARSTNGSLAEVGILKGRIGVLPHERLAFSPICERAPLTLPGGKRLAVWVIVNVEVWDPRQPMPRSVLTPPAGGSPMPDIANWSWHEYGNRVGFWRLLKVLDALSIRATLAINGSAIAAYEPIARAARDSLWEFIGHGFAQRSMQMVENEADDIARTTEAIAAFVGRRPRGWLGPGLTETWETPDLLVEGGYEYLCDWVLDDEPVRINTRSGPILSVPYTQECNDLAMMLIQHHPAREYERRAIDQFEQLREDAASSARVMAIVVHPYIMGVPHRLKYFHRVLSHIDAAGCALFWTGEEILDWYKTSRPL
jgi:peptidoglycan/xylan/chitin deacetylase (PgdA/CDA1 family)